MNELFDITPSLSPRLRWMQANHITTHFLDLDFGDGTEPLECPETGEDIYPWMAERLPHDRAQGWTETEALQKLSMQLGIKLWNA